MKKTLLALVMSKISLFGSAADYSVIDDFIANNKQTTQLSSGTAVAIVKDDKIVYEGYFGYEDIEKRIKVKQDSVFYIGSMTKAFYSLLTLIKENKGELDTNQTLNKLYPNIKFKASLQANQVTMADLLSHTSGIDNWPLVQATAYTGLYNNETISNIISKSYVNDNAPYGTYHYTNIGYNILSHWMDDHFSQSWRSLLHSELFQPLGMTQTSAFMSDINKHNWNDIKGYSVRSAEPNKPVYLIKTDETMHAAGGMVSTVKDLTNFIRAQINLGKLGNEQIIASEVVKKSHQALTENKHSRGYPNYGWGWGVVELYNQKLLEHRGGFSGASTYMSFMPEKKMGLIVLSNQDKWGGDLAYAIEAIAYAILMDKPSEEISHIVTDNENYILNKVEKFYNTKTPKPVAVKTKIQLPIEGRYQNELLGSIEVIFQDNKGYTLKWGNLKSPLFQAENANNFDVEFRPNLRQPIVFLSASNHNTYLEFNDHRFTLMK